MLRRLTILLLALGLLVPAGPVVRAATPPPGQTKCCCAKARVKSCCSSTNQWMPAAPKRCPCLERTPPLPLPEPPSAPVTTPPVVALRDLTLVAAPVSLVLPPGPSRLIEQRIPLDRSGPTALFVLQPLLRC